MTTEEYLLKVRHNIAIIEFQTAEANMELHRYGQWQSNHRQVCEECSREIAELEKYYKAYSKYA